MTGAWETPRAARFENGGALSPRPQALAGRGVPHGNGHFPWEGAKEEPPRCSRKRFGLVGRQRGNACSQAAPWVIPHFAPRRVSEPRQNDPIGKQPDVPAALPRDFRTLNRESKRLTRRVAEQRETAARPVEANGRGAKAPPDFSFGMPPCARTAHGQFRIFASRGFRKPGGCPGRETAGLPGGRFCNPDFSAP